MRRFALILLCFALAAPAWAGKTMTVAQLEQMLRSMQQDKKTDVEIADALKQVELSEQLTQPTMNSLVQFVPGPHSTEQMFVLEALSANLAPPADDLPSISPPDPAEQKNILSRADAYVTNTYGKLPAFTATRTTLRFQDDVTAVAGSSGVVGSAQEIVTGSAFTHSAAYIHYINSSASPVTLERGAERTPAEKDKTNWGANRMIAVQSPQADLGAVYREAQQAGTFQWLRWELLYGKSAAVFSFSVARKQSRQIFKVCCFPKIDQTGVARFYTSTTASVLGGEGATGGGVAGNYQTRTEWHDFRTTAPYHGELFVDPQTGVVVRLIVQPEFRPTDVVHQLDTRIDYAPVKIGSSLVIAPVRTFIKSVVVPGGESGSGTYSTRCTLFTSEFKDFRPGTEHAN